MELGRFGGITVARRNFSANLKSVCQLRNSLVFRNTADSALAFIRMTQSAEGCRIVDGPNFNSVRPTLSIEISRTGWLCILPVEFSVLYLVIY